MEDRVQVITAKQNVLRWAALILVLLGAIAIALIVQLGMAIVGIGDIPLENDVLHSYQSPDHTRTIVEFYRYGGVGSDLIREFSELRTGKRLGNEEGNLFRCSGAGDWQGYKNPSPVKVYWTDNLHVQLTYPNNLDFIETEPEHRTRDVIVSFNPR